MIVNTLIQGAPYYDNSTEADLNNYYKILFIPGRAVQARELTQMQSIQFKQFQKLGDHFFKNGSVVIPGDISFNTNLKSIIFDITAFSGGVKNNLSDPEYVKANIIGKFLSNGVIKASVDYVTNIDINTIKFYITYISGNSTVTEFEEDEIIDLVDIEDAVILNNIEVGLKDNATAATITDGVFYVNGIFVNVYNQSAIIAEDAAPTLSVGLRVEEKIITENLDASLVDPASGTSNFNAPGAHRYQINLILTAYELESVIETNDNYIELLRIEEGLATKHVTRSTYNILAEEFARRTFDESGDYTVRPFIASIEENAEDDTTLKLALEAGKAYVKGYEVETISKTYVNNLEKSRDFAVENNKTIHTPVGNYIICYDATEAFPLVSSHGSANIYNYAGTLIGTLKVRQILPLGSISDPFISESANVSQYKVSIFDVRITTGYDFSDAYSIGTANLKIKVKQDLYKLEGLVSTTNNLQLTGNPDTRWFTSLESSLHADDILLVIDLDKKPHYLRVSTTPSNNTTLAIVATNAASWNAQVAANKISTVCPFYLAYSAIKNTNEARLLFSLPYNRIKSIRDGSGVVDTNYIYSREVTGSITSNSSIITAPVGSDEFISANVNDYLVYGPTINGGNPGVVVPSGVSLAGNQATLTFSGKANQSITVVTLFRDSNAPEKNKTYTTNQTYTFAASGVNAAKSISDFWIPNADIYKIVSILNQTSENITDDYIFDNGQNDAFYDLGKLTLKQGKPIPTAVTVTYNYFAHSTGTYFSVNSYSVNLIEVGKGYEYIPTYISKTDGKKWDLRDCLDFRPTINSTRTGFAHTSNIPVGYVSADFQYYLNRIDKLCLNQKGEFKIVKGISGLNPTSPATPSDAMALYDIQLRAYTFGPEDAFVKYIENKRYTMRDIGKLETRISNLEYYTTLSLIEKETQDMEILDENGLTRFKNGFIVDPFNGHGIGDVTNPEYKCSVDMRLAECRPSFKSDIIDLILDDINDLQQTGDLITLPYTETVFIDQPLATEFINVNPYNVFSFLGRLDLVPPVDNWKDTRFLPDLIVNQEGNYDSMVESANAYGTVWNEWETQWFGTDIDKDTSRKVVAYGKNSPNSKHGTNWPRQVETTVTTTTTKTGMATRSGTQLKVVPETVITDLGSKLVDVSYVPYMRTIDVKFVGKGFKPTTRVYAFFDDVNVSAYCSTGTVFNPAATINTTALVTDATGKAQGVFRIPASEVLRFKTGKRKFTLSDSSTNSELLRTTFGSEMFEASGLLETKQNTIISTRNAKLVQDTIIDNKAVSKTNVSTKTTTKWEDPLAQSFLNVEQGGCFASSVDLYFASKDPSIPVIVYISEMVNGYPSQTILPFSEVVVDSDDINVTPPSDILLASEIEATNIQFKSPVYLEENREYAIVIVSNSNAYNLWIATGGKNKIGTQIPIQSQPYLGTLFKSQNASTWTTQQESDLKFRLNKCTFDTSTELECNFKNKEIIARPISGISYLKPVASGTADTFVKVDISNHGLNPTTGKITISGASTVGDISAGLLNGTHTIEFADLNYVTFKLLAVVHTAGAAANTIVSGNATNVKAITNLPYDTLFINARTINLPQTELSFGIGCTFGSHPQDSLALSSEYVGYVSEIPAPVNQTIEFSDGRKVFVSEENMINVSEPNSFNLVALLSSDNPNLSPVIDTQGLSAVTVENLVDTPLHTFKSVFDSKKIVNAASVVANATTGTLSVTSASTQFVDVKIGNVITIESSTGNDGNYTVINKVDDGTNTIITTLPAIPNTITQSITVYLNTKFVDEISPGSGNAAAKYVARNFQLAQPATSLRIQFAAYWPNTFDIEVYYKTLHTDSANGVFSDGKYVKAVLNTPVVYSNNYNDYREYTFDVADIIEFSALSAKLVFKGLNSCDVPKIRDLRIIALS